MTEFETRVESYDVQPNGNIKTSALMRIMQKVSGDDLDGSDLTYMSLFKKNMAFVLSKICLQMYGDIKLYDTITVKTYPRPVKGAAFLRDFAVYCGSRLVAYANSTWCLLDLESRKLLRPNALDGIGLIDTTEENRISLPAPRHKPILSESARTGVREIMYSQLDMNGHFNNTYYADCIFDSIMPEVHKSDANMFLEITYRNEIRLSDSLTLYLSPKESGEYDFSAVKNSDGNLCFTAYLNINGESNGKSVGEI